MEFEYSCFISYRREEQRNKFIKSFCTYLCTKAKDSTNISKVFIDEQEIKNGVPFPEKLYESIKRSCVFAIFNTQHYLHEDDNWCAKELFYALKVEERRKEIIAEEDKSKYNWLLILLVNGTVKHLPNIINTRIAHSIKEFEYFGKLLKNKKSKELIDELGSRIDEIFHIYQKNPKPCFIECCKDIPYPTDEEIKVWIKEQKYILEQTEAKNTPILKKNDV